MNCTSVSSPSFSLSPVFHPQNTQREGEADVSNPSLYTLVCTDMHNSPPDGQTIHSVDFLFVCDAFIEKH